MLDFYKEANTGIDRYWRVLPDGTEVLRPLSEISVGLPIMTDLGFGRSALYNQSADLFGIGLAGIVDAYSDNGFTTSFAGMISGDFTATGGQSNAVLIGVQPFGMGSGQATTNYGYDINTDNANIGMSVRSNFGTQAAIILGADPTGANLEFYFGGGNNYSFPVTQPTPGTALGYVSPNTLGWVSIGGGGGMAIGATVTGASADSVLFVKTVGLNNVLAEEPSGLVYQVGGNFFVGNGLGSAFLEISPSGTHYAIGDIDNTHNKTRLYIDDAARTVKVRTDVTFGVHDTSGNTFLNVDLQSVSRGVQLGDIAAAFHKTLFSVDDFNSRITATIPLFFNIQNALGQRVMTADVSSGAGGFVWKAGDVDNVIGANGTQISVDDGNTIAQMGNISGNMGGTVLQVQDSMLQIHAITSGHFRVVNLSGQAWLDINTAGSGQIGDISGSGNGTFFIVNDFSQQIINTLQGTWSITDNNAGQHPMMLVDTAARKITVGDAQPSYNQTRAIFDDLNQTISMNNGYAGSAGISFLSNWHVDGLTGNVSIGDVLGNNNNTILYIDDVARLIQMGCVHLRLPGLVPYANNAAALGAGLVSGDAYLVTDAITGSYQVQLVI